MMAELSEWQLCQFAEDIPNVHDNFLYAVSVDFDEGHLTLYTEFRDGDGPKEKTDVRFVGLIAYQFDDAMGSNILFDISQHSPKEVVKQWGDYLDSRRNWIWPIDFNDLNDLSCKLEEQRVCGYNVHSSFGLSGFILAKEAEYRQRNKLVKFN